MKIFSFSFFLLTFGYFEITSNLLGETVKEVGKAVIKIASKV